jgi:hypothetical protein
MASDPNMIAQPPFPDLAWTDNDWWEGTAHLPAWAGFQSRGGAYGARDGADASDGSVSVILAPYDPAVSRLPTDAQCRAFAFQRERGAEVVASVLAALVPYYARLRPRWAAHYDPETLVRIMPEVAGAEDFRHLIGLSQVHVHPWRKGALSFVGLEFGCTWDPEHGLGAMLLGAEVVRIGAADVAFAWEPECAESH